MESYNTISKWFHWITVALMAVALPVGFVIQHITDKDEGATKLVFYAIHESAGVTLFVVVLLRLLWRLRHPAPPLPPACRGRCGRPPRRCTIRCMRCCWCSRSSASWRPMPGASRCGARPPISASSTSRW
ncbi:cytochrome b/b6 domain-containing protein [Siccirubricoccus deserti]